MWLVHHILDESHHLDECYWSVYYIYDYYILM